MKKILILMTLLIVFVVYVVAQAVIQGQSSKEANKIIDTISSRGCSSEPPRDEVFLKSSYSEIRKLGEFEFKCSSKVSNQLVYKTLLSKDAITAKELANRAAKVLDEYSNYGVHPLIFVEADTKLTQNDLYYFGLGYYDSSIESFFKELSSLGITEQSLGTIVLLPEANLPKWSGHSMDSQDYSNLINRYIAIAKKYYPGIKISLMLSSSTYQDAGFSWESREYLSFKPYLEGIDPHTISSFGVSAYPWIPSGDQKGQPMFNVKEYFAVNLVTEAATMLDLKDVWYFTGTFSTYYTSDNNKTVFVPAETRKDLLDQVLAVSKDLKATGYDVSLVINAEDKSGVLEGVDWSYWGSNYTQNEAHSYAIMDFLRDASASGIPVSLALK